MLRHRKLTLESLETRTVLSAAPVFPAVAILNGELSIVGTKMADNIQVQMSGTDIVITANGQNTSIASALVTSNKLSIDSGAGNDQITIADNVLLSATIHGNVGNDFIQSGALNDFLFGDAGNDTIYGNGGDDTISGGLGKDLIHGNDGNDTITGDAGNDEIFGDAGNDQCRGGAPLRGNNGNNILHGGDGNDVLYGDTGNDILYGDAGMDSLICDWGNDIAHGGDGNDYVFGDPGNDILYGDAGWDQVSGDWGNDLIHGGAGPDILSGGVGKDKLYGDDGDDEIFGGPGNDLLQGDTGNDVVFGEDGNDKIGGGDGDDYLDGALGNDVCNGGNGNDKLIGGDGADKLNGDAGNNLIDSSGPAGDVLTGGLPANLQNELHANWYFGGPQPFGQPTISPGGRVLSSYKLQNSAGQLTATFTVVLESDQYNQSFDVRLGGVLVGQIFTDSNGDGTLKFSTDPAENGPPFPVNFPTLAEGSVIKIGNMTQRTLTHGYFN